MKVRIVSDLKLRSRLLTNLLRVRYGRNQINWSLYIIGVGIVQQSCFGFKNVRVISVPAGNTRWVDQYRRDRLIVNIIFKIVDKEIISLVDAMPLQHFADIRRRLTAITNYRKRTRTEGER